MLSAARVILYADNAPAARAFFRDVLSLPALDAGEGWMILSRPPAEVAAHPTEGSGPA